MAESEQLNNPTENITPTSKSKKPLWKLIVVLILIGGLVMVLYYALVLSKRDTGELEDIESEEQITSEDGEWDPDADPNVDRPVVDITIEKDGFSPDSITIKTGTVVVWTNQSGGVATVNSSPHPAHTDNPILNLDELANGDKFSLTFDTAGTYKYHNHLDATQFGTIVVTD